ncbi:hypothetical protein Y032_0491g2408 [Ancylostoma ceylanicum]|uniref:Uncharacterized protein n=1 Tax=Ancylostoma ceylanicum TaxID=53326 RepID=A0A016WX15_9BILA|nr:hypothetical protein Y032_0491g2408 [Ancylostoma ceylanicum]
MISSLTKELREHHSCLKERPKIMYRSEDIREKPFSGNFVELLRSPDFKTVLENWSVWRSKGALQLYAQYCQKRLYTCSTPLVLCSLKIPTRSVAFTLRRNPTESKPVEYVLQSNNAADLFQHVSSCIRRDTSTKPLSPFSLRAISEAKVSPTAIVEIHPMRARVGGTRLSCISPRSEIGLSDPYHLRAAGPCKTVYRKPGLFPGKTGQL